MKKLLHLALLCVCLLWAQSAFSACTSPCVHETFASITFDGSGNANITIPSTTAGNLLIAFQVGSSGSPATSDATNGTWSTPGTGTGSCGEFSSRDCDWFYFANTAAGVTTAVAHSVAFNSAIIDIAEFSGIATASALNTNGAMGPWASSGTWTSASITPTSSIHILLVGIIYADNSDTLVAGSGFTLIASNIGAGPVRTIGFEFKDVPVTSGSYTTFGSTTSGGAGIAAAFVAAGGGSTGGSRSLLGVGK